MIVFTAPTNKETHVWSLAQVWEYISLGALKYLLPKLKISPPPAEHLWVVFKMSKNENINCPNGIEYNSVILRLYRVLKANID